MEKQINYEPIGKCYTASWDLLKLYPRFWYANIKDTPGFKHWSFTIRFLWWMFGIQRKYKHVYSPEETYLFNLERDQPERNTEHWKRTEFEKQKKSK